MSGSLQPVPPATLLPTTRAASGGALNAAGVLESVGASLQALSAAGAAYL
jgi:hypothetical protein